MVGATVEEAGFDKRTNVETIQRLHRAAIAIVPELRNAKILEDWAGLRPGTPDALPILGPTATPGYYVGHRPFSRRNSSRPNHGASHGAGDDGIELQLRPYAVLTSKVFHSEKLASGQLFYRAKRSAAQFLPVY